MNEFEKTVLCIHDTDNDGKFAGAIIQSIYSDAVMVGWRYGEPLSLVELEKEHGKFDLIIVCDLPLLAPIKEWNDLEGSSAGLTIDDNMLTNIMGYEVLWFDHHGSNRVDMVERNLWPVSGLHDVNYSATWNTYKYFDELSMVAENVQCIKYIDTYDCWRKNDEGPVSWDKALAFHFGFSLLEEKDDTQFIVDNLINNDEEEDIIEVIIKDGEAIKNYIQQKAEHYESQIVYYEIDGVNIAFVNVTSEKSYTAELIKHDGDAICCWSFAGDLYLYSLRTKKDIDVSLIAKKFGGGGHTKAAGFSSDKLIFKEINL